jgi:hypothetical protein
MDPVTGLSYCGGRHGSGGGGFAETPRSVIISIGALFTKDFMRKFGGK